MCFIPVLARDQALMAIEEEIIREEERFEVARKGGGYSEKDDLPKLYSLTAKALNLAPDRHTAEPIKAILGGAMTMVNGLGTLRNRLSDAHGRGGKIRSDLQSAMLASL